MARQSIEQIATEVAPKVTWSGAGTGLAGFLASSHFIGLLGVLIALAGFGVTWYYKHRDDRRNQIEHERRMEKMRTAPSPLDEGDPS